MTEKSKEEKTLAEIFRLLRNATGVNFTHYKRNTVRRRIERRMLLYKLEKQADYVRYLQDHPDEVQALYRDLLIIVTQFFRDESAFNALKKLVFPRIVSGSDSPIRIWIPGCATGEEVYSIAICLLEFLAEQTLKPAIQIFGTDLSETAIEIARTGIYQSNRLAGLDPQRLRRFFIQTEAGYQISKRIRELCVFARHDLNSDPPFSSLDLISCRNVLIYFAPPLQKRVLPLFHYSLKPTGFLLLGSSESVGDDSDLFAELNKKFRIYARTQVPSRLSYERSFGNCPPELADLDEDIEREFQGTVRVQERAERIILDRYAPVGVLCTERLEILQFRGDTSAYLRPAPGEPSFNLLKMVRPSLLPELRAIIHQAKRQDSSTSKAGLRVAETDQQVTVEIEVIPFRVPPARERYWLISFKPSFAPAVEMVGDRSNGEQTEAELQNRQLRQELTDAQAYLQATMEEQESTNQRLAAANEEILSSNEELQSTNEELQTAKEEIQAANEELRTTNDELQHRNLEARHSSDDLLNLLKSVELPILMLQDDLRIRRFTPAARKIFNLIASDVGRLFSDIRPNINIPDLESLIREAIDTPTILEREVRDRAGRWYSLSIRPYKTTENQVDGAVLSLIDIDNLKRNAERLRASRDYAEAIVETVRQPLVVLDEELRVKIANRSFYQMFQISPAQTERQPFFELGNGQWNIPHLRQPLEEMLSNNNQFQDFELEHEFEKIGAKTLLLNARELVLAEEGRSILLAIEDITQRQQLEAERTQLLVEQIARTEAEAANASKDQFISTLSHELRTPINSISGWTQLLQQTNFDEETTARGLETIERNARLQSQLIEDLLDISRIVRKELRLEFRSLSVASVIEAAVETVRPTAEQKKIQLELNLPPSSVWISGDYNRIQQVIFNLLSNAIKFTPEGGRIEIHLTCSTDHTQIQTIDTGRGISPDFLPHIFERFRQSDSASIRKYGGLGLGLAIVRELVELHRGTVTAQSPGEGRGATFTVRLPLITTPLETSINLVEASEPAFDLTDIKILVVEDNDDARGLMTLWLEEEKANVTAVASARAALEALNQSLPDIILSDVSMPEVDGYTLIRQIRALPQERGGQIPAIALTGYAEESDRQQAVTAGFQRHITKPVKLEELTEAIASLMVRRDNS